MSDRMLTPLWLEVINPAQLQSNQQSEATNCTYEKEGEDGGGTVGGGRLGGLFEMIREVAL